MSKDILISYIQKTLPISLEKAAELSDKFQYKEYNKNLYLLREAQISNHSHFLEEGYIHSYALNTEGNEVTTAIYSAPSFANDFLSFFKREPCRESLQALVNCKTWFLNYEDVQNNFHSIPEFREFGRMLLINNYSVLKDRMLGMIQKSAKERYELLLTIQPNIFLNVPLKVIASYLGMTATSLSRLRGDILKNR